MLLAVSAQLVISAARGPIVTQRQSVAANPPAEAVEDEPNPAAPIAPAVADVVDAKALDPEGLPDLAPVPPEADEWPAWEPADDDPPKFPRPAVVQQPAAPAAPPVQAAPVIVQPIDFPKGPDPLLVNRINAIRTQAAQLQSEIQSMTADRQRVFNEGRTVYASGSRVSREAAAIRSQIFLLD